MSELLSKSGIEKSKIFLILHIFQRHHIREQPDVTPAMPITFAGIGRVYPHEIF